MILEHALLHIGPGEAQAFERAMEEARPFISTTPGFLGMEVRPCIEKPNLYLLLVRWEKIEDHEIGFRRSDRYPKWSQLLHGFYEPFPEVLHFAAPAIQA